ncbi:M23 family metallopeptidase [Catenulispora subtropica]|uniref:M23ase beta-sheet core domain-containing protein n=1 Tax=Catenulispora subtropica TaxID=450798 RepID=A0ABN2SLD2_9ACTN
MSAFGRFLGVGRSRGARIGLPAGLAVFALPLAGIAGTHSGGHQQAAGVEAQTVLQVADPNEVHAAVPSTAPAQPAEAPAQPAPAPASAAAPAPAPAPIPVAPTKPKPAAPTPAPTHTTPPVKHIAAAPVAFTVAAKTVISDVAPLASLHINENYGVRGPWAAGHHTGVDFAAAVGTRVASVGAGTVVRSGWDGAYGIDVLVKMTDGKYVLYGHLSQASVFAGEHVTAGEQIGRSGATGNVTGPHLHFEVRTTPDYGSDVNPIAYLRAHGVAV